MAGHSKFKNIQHRKGAQDAKRAKKFTKLIREIIVAAKTGEPNPEFNPRLRTALTAAREANLPKDRIENAIKKATSPGDSENFEEVTYECYLPGGVALIIEALTDNRNRTSSEVKSTLGKHGGTLASQGSVLYLFDRVGLLEFKDEKITPEAMLEAVVEAGGNECESLPDNMHEVLCDHDKLHEIQTFLAEKFGEPTTAKLIWKPKSGVEVTASEQAEKLFNVIDILEDNDDVQSVHGNYVISDEIMEKLK